MTGEGRHGLDRILVQTAERSLRAVRLGSLVPTVDAIVPGHRHHAPGTAPGTIDVGDDPVSTTIDVIAWSATDVLAEGRVTTDRVAEVHGDSQWAMTWVNVEGFADVAALRDLAAQFGLHPLVLEDITSEHQRAKTEEWDEHRFVVARMSSVRSDHITEQVSLYFGPGFLLSFQEGVEGDAFDLVRRRIHQGSDLMRQQGSDYLAYALVDAVVDGFFPVLEQYGDRLEDIEEHILLTPQPHLARQVHHVKRDLLAIRRAIWPLREAVNALLRDDSGAITRETHQHLLDTYDHVAQVIDLLETFREFGSGLVDLYLSSVSNRMNDIMKVLTIISVIFIPLTFIVGVYGMNFDTRSHWNMPELKWHYGYVVTMAAMLLIAIGQIAYFRRLGWLGSTEDDGIGEDRKRRQRRR